MIFFARHNNDEKLGKVLGYVLAFYKVKIIHFGFGQVINLLLGLF